MDVREVTDETFLSDVAKLTNNKKAQTALIKNKASQIISEKAHLNPAYYEKMKERLDNLIREEQEKRKEDADYFNSYKKILQELLDEENERKKLGLSNTFEFAVFEELVKITKDKETSKKFTKKISEGIREETELVGWKTKTSSEKQLGNVIYDIVSEIQNKKLSDNEDKKNELTERLYRISKKKSMNLHSEEKSKQTFQYGNKTIEYILIKSKRRKTCEVIVDKDEITIRAPFDKPLNEVEGILNDKIKWISQKQKEIQNEKPEIVKPSFDNNSTLPYLGKNYQFENNL